MNGKKEARRQEILNGALAIFAQKGYDKTTMDDVVKATGLSKGTLYWHFKNKQDLFLAMVALLTSQAMDLFDEILQASENDLSPPDTLRKIYSKTADFLETNPLFSAMTADFFLQALHDEDLKKQFANYYIGYIDRVAQIIQRGIDEGHFKAVDTHSVATSLVGSLDGISLLKLLEQDLHGLAGTDFNVRVILEAAVDLTLAGLENGEKNAR